MPEIIRPEQLGDFWTYGVVGYAIDKLGVFVKRNVSPNPRIKQWQPIDPGTNEMLVLPITKQDLLNIVGPGEYHILLKFNLDDGRHGLYGRGVFVTVGVEKKVAETPPEHVTPTPSPEIERLKATLDEQRATLAGQKTFIDTMTETLKKRADQQKSADNQFKDQLLMKLIDQQKSTGSEFSEQLLLKLLDKMGNQVDVGSIYSKVFETTSQIMADGKKEETELKRQESKQKHEIEKQETLIKIQQQRKAGKAGRAEVKNDGSPEDDAKKANVVPDIVDVVSKVGSIVDKFAQFAEKVKPTVKGIKDIINIAQGKPLAPEKIATGDEDEEAPVVEEEQPAEEPASVKPRIISIGRARIKEPEPAEDESRVWVNKGSDYDPNDLRKQ